MTHPTTVLSVGDARVFLMDERVHLEARRCRGREWSRLALFPGEPVTGTQTLAVIRELAGHAT